MNELGNARKRVVLQRVAIGALALASLVLLVDMAGAMVDANRIKTNKNISGQFSDQKSYRIHTAHTVHRYGSYRVHTGHTLARTGVYIVHTVATPHIRRDTDAIEVNVFKRIIPWKRLWF
ncbi:MAG: hypothetical protein AAB733_01705 [Patescibacteria group bacterium]